MTFNQIEKYKIYCDRPATLSIRCTPDHGCVKFHFHDHRKPTGTRRPFPRNYCPCNGPDAMTTTGGGHHRQPTLYLSASVEPVGFGVAAFGDWLLGLRRPRPRSPSMNEVTTVRKVAIPRDSSARNTNRASYARGCLDGFYRFTYQWSPSWRDSRRITPSGYVAQLVRASGSYPLGPGFESPRSH